MSRACFIQNAPIRTTRDLRTTSFFKRVPAGQLVDVLEHAVADNGQQVTKVRMSDGTEGWTSSWHLDVDGAAGEGCSRR